MGWQATGFRHLLKLLKWQLTISRQLTDSRYLRRLVNNYFAKSKKKKSDISCHFLGVKLSLVSKFNLILKIMPDNGKKRVLIHLN